jgi:hypothetical protein
LSLVQRRLYRSPRQRRSLAPPLNASGIAQP